MLVSGEPFQCEHALICSACLCFEKKRKTLPVLTFRQAGVRETAVFKEGGNGQS